MHSSSLSGALAYFVVALVGFIQAVQPTPQPDDGDDAHNHPVGFICPVCDEVEARIALVRADTTPPTVTRPAANLIVVEGAMYAGTRPLTEPMRGVPIQLAEIVHQADDGEPIWFLVDAATEYQVWTAVRGPDGLAVPFDFVLSSPDRVGLLVHALQMQLEAEAIRDSLAPVSFFEWIAALNILNAPAPAATPDQENPDEQGGRDEIQGPDRVDQARQEAGPDVDRDSGAQPEGEGPADGGRLDLDHRLEPERAGARGADDPRR